MTDATKSEGLIVVETAKALAWPFVALVFLALFYSPVRQLVSNVAERMQDINSVKLGQLELSVRKSDLPIPSNETAKVLKSFDGTLFTELLGLSDGSGPCFPDENLNNNPEYIALKKLEKLKQITLVAEKQTNEWCANPYKTALTDSGRETRSFLIALLSSQIGSK